MSIINSFTPSTVISSSQVNANFSDIATELTNSLALDGQSTMSGQIKAADGTVGAPGISFGADLDNGLYRTGANAFSMAIAGAQAMGFAATGVSFPKAMVWVKGADITCAATLVVLADGNYFDVAGSTGPVTAFTVTAGTLFMLQFDSTPTLTHHATNLNLPGGANIVAAAGDRAICFAEAANQVRVVSYIKASGLPIKVDGTIIRMGSDAQGDIIYFNGTNFVRLAPGTSGHFLKTQGAGANPIWAESANAGLVFLATATASASATIDFTTAAAFDGTYAGFKVIGRNIVPATDSVGLLVRISIAAAFGAGANDYQWGGLVCYQDSAGVTADRSDAGIDGFDISNFTGNGAQGLGTGTSEVFNFELTCMKPEATTIKPMSVRVWQRNETAKFLDIHKTGGYVASGGAIDGIRFLCTSDNIASGDFYLFGIRKA